MKWITLESEMVKSLARGVLEIATDMLLSSFSPTNVYITAKLINAQGARRVVQYSSIVSTRYDLYESYSLPRVFMIRHELCIS